MGWGLGAGGRKQVVFEINVKKTRMRAGGGKQFGIGHEIW
jgi:hypothetical protein